MPAKDSGRQYISLMLQIHTYQLLTGVAKQPQTLQVEIINVYHTLRHFKVHFAGGSNKMFFKSRWQIRYSTHDGCSHGVT